MKEIGGYFELELKQNDDLDIPARGVLVNSGRHALEYILRANKNKINRIFLPYYTCDVVLEPIRRIGLKYIFYRINETLEITEDIDLSEGDLLLVNNYFGIKDDYISKLVCEYQDRLIVDNAQAWYYVPKNGGNYIYSPRKFFGVPDGGVAVSVSGLEESLKIGYSSSRCSHLLKRIDSGAGSGYDDFKENSLQLKDEPLTAMSNLTRRLLRSIDYDIAKERRHSNFKMLHSALGTLNKFNVPDLDKFACPMIYPFQTEDLSLRKKLIEKKIFVAKYWSNVQKWCNLGDFEYKFTEELIPIPIDHRYGASEMNRIVRVIIENINE